MVRYLFIRHGMTNSNLRDARMTVKVARGDVTPEEAHAMIDEEAAAGVSYSSERFAQNHLFQRHTHTQT